MKQVFSRILILFMAVAVLGSTVGITVYKHTCFAANYTKTSVFELKSCCGEKEEKGLGPRCCETKLSYVRVQDEKRTSARVMPLVPVQEMATVAVIYNEENGCEIHTWDAALSFRPPPLSGCEISLRNQVIRS